MTWWWGCWITVPLLVVVLAALVWVLVDMAEEIRKEGDAWPQS